jgi:hypothetical protein
MGRDKKWTNELKGELVKFFTEAEDAGNKSVLKNSEEFAKRYENLTPSQVKTAYYKFYEEAKRKDYEHATVANRWSNKENDDLLKAVSRKKGTLAEVFENHARLYGRTHNNVSQHYYFLMRQNAKRKEKNIKEQGSVMKNNQWTKKTKAKEIEKLTKTIQRLPLDKIESLYNIVSAINKKQ